MEYNRTGGEWGGDEHSQGRRRAGSGDRTMVACGLVGCGKGRMRRQREGYWWNRKRKRMEKETKVTGNTSERRNNALEVKG